MFAIELDKRGREHGVRAFAVHPGAIKSGLGRNMSDEEKVASGAYSYKTPEQGAATSVWCAVTPMLDGKGGLYCEDGDIAEDVPPDSQLLRGVRPWAIDPAAAEKLWAISEDLLNFLHETIPRSRD